MTININTYKTLLEQDIKYLMHCPPALEREHILAILDMKYREYNQAEYIEDISVDGNDTPKKSIDDNFNNE